MKLKELALCAFSFFVAAMIQALNIIFDFSRDDIAEYGIFALVLSIVFFISYYKKLKREERNEEIKY